MKQWIWLALSLTLFPPACGGAEIVDVSTPSWRDLRQTEIEEALESYLAIQRRGGWPGLSVETSLNSGDEGAEVTILKKRLAMTGDLPKGHLKGRVFDKSLERAVGKFQRRHGLAANGTIDADTLRALNVPVEERVKQLRETLAALKELPADMGRRFLLANIPEHMLYVWDGGVSAMKLRIITGRPEHHTPALSSKIDRILLNPAWTVPKSGLEPILASIKKDSGYLEKANIQVFQNGMEIDPRTVNWIEASTTAFRYALHQQPGPSNPLGSIEFVFPNRFGIHLHDTPAQELFSEPDRDRSLGCVRVERALELAAFFLETDSRWPAERLKDARNSGFSRTIWLDAPVGIHLVNWTAWVDDRRTVQFRDEPSSDRPADTATIHPQG